MIEFCSGFRWRLRTGLVVLLIGVSATGCGGLPTRMEPPSVTIADFGVGNVSLFEQQFNLRLRIQNPNAEELRIDGMAFDLEINDRPFAKGVGSQAVTLPRYGSGYMPVEAVSSLGGLAAQLGALARAGRPGFKYRIKGTLHVGGNRIPFERNGELDFSLAAPPSPAGNL